MVDMPAGQVPTEAPVPEGQAAMEAMAAKGATQQEVLAYKTQKTTEFTQAGVNPAKIRQFFGDAPPPAPQTRASVAAHLGANAGPQGVDFGAILTDPIKTVGAMVNAEYTGLKPFFDKKDFDANQDWAEVRDNFKGDPAGPQTSLGGETEQPDPLSSILYGHSPVLAAFELPGAMWASTFGKFIAPLIDAGPGKDLAALTAGLPHGEHYDFRMPTNFTSDTVGMIAGVMTGGDTALRPSPVPASIRAAAEDGTHSGEMPAGPASIVDHIVPPGTDANVNLKTYMPYRADFTAAATKIIGHGLNAEALRRVSSNLYHIWTNTGLLPAEAAAKAETDGVFREEVMNQHTDGTPSTAHFNAARRPEPQPYGDAASATTVMPGDKTMPVYAHSVDEAMDIMAKLEGSGDKSLGPITAENKGERAVGKYQIEPYAARAVMGANFDVRTLSDPTVNRAVARVIITDLYNKTHGNMEAMAIAYDGGPERLHTWQNNGPGTRLEAVQDPNMRTGWRYIKVTADRDESNLPLETQEYVARARSHMGAAGKTEGDQYEATADFIKSLGPGYRDTSDYRSPAHEAQLGREGAGIAKGISNHSRGTPEAPGAHDLVPTGDWNAALAHIRSQPGVKDAFIEAAHGPEGRHIHVDMAQLGEPEARANPEELPKVQNGGVGTTPNPDTGELEPWEFPPEHEEPVGEEKAAQDEANAKFDETKVDPQTGEIPAGAGERSGGAADAWNDERPHGDAYEEMWNNVGDQRDLPDAPGMSRYYRWTGALLNKLQYAEAVDNELRAAGQQKDGEYTVRQAFTQASQSGTRARIAAVEGPIHYDPEKLGPGRPGWTADRDGPSAIKALEAAEATGRGQDAIAWLMARRTVVLKHNHGLDNGHNLAAAEHIMRIEEDRALFQPIADIWDGWNRGVIQNAVDGRGDGLGSILKPGVENKLNNMAWVSGRKLRGDTPDVGVGRNGGPSLDPGSVLHKMTGKDGKVLDPVLASIDNNAMIQQSVEVNMARQELVEAAQRSPELAAAAGIRRVDAKATEVGLDQIRAELSKMGVPEEDLDDAADKFGHFIQEREDAMLKPGQFPVYYNGERQLWQTSWPELLQLVDGSTAKQVQFLNKVVPAILRVPAQKVARAIQFGTEALPAFAPSTFFGHQLIQWFNNKEGPPPVLTGFAKMVDAVGMSDLMVDAMANGALGTSIADMDHFGRYDALNATLPSADTFSRVRNSVSEWKDTPNLKTTTAAAANVLTSPLLLGKWMIQKGNASNRLGLYRQGLARGESPLTAGAKAAEQGIDYAQGPGSGFVHWWSTMVPFMRPSLLYTENFLTGFKRAPAHMAAKGFAAITLPKTALFFINTAQDQIAPGQPGYVPEADKYRNVPLWERYYYFHSPYVNGGRAKLRMPAGAGFLFGAIPEITLQAMHDKDPAEFVRLGQAFVEDFAPDGFAPPLYKTIAEQATGRNMDTFGPMVPGSVAGSLPQLQYTPNSSWIARKLGDILGPPGLAILGPNATIDTPIGLDRLMKSLSGTGGIRAISGLNIDPGGKHDWMGADNPFWGNWAARHPGVGGQEMDDFYTAKDQWDVYAKSKGVLKREIETGDQSNAGLVPEVWNLAQVDAQMDRVAKQLATYKEQITRISRDPTMSPAEKSQHVDELADQADVLAHVATRTMRKYQGLSNPTEGPLDTNQSEFQGAQ